MKPRRAMKLTVEVRRLANGVIRECVIDESGPITHRGINLLSRRSLTKPESARDAILKRIDSLLTPLGVPFEIIWRETL